MSLMAVAVIKDAKGIIQGFNLIDTYKKQTKFINTQSVTAALKSAPGCIANLDLDAKANIISNNGKLDRYPTFIKDRYGKLIPKENGKSLIVIGKYGDVGYYVSDCYGKIFRVANKQVVEYAEVHGIANGKLRTLEDGSKTVSSIEGSYEIIDAPPVQNKVAEEKSEKKTNKRMKPRVINSELYDRSIMTSPEENKTNKEGLLDTTKWEEYKVPILSNRYMYDDENALQKIDEALGMTAEQKLAVASSILKAIDPFLYAAYLSIQKYGNTSCKTMGVTSNTLVYNINFVLEHNISQLAYVLKHEMDHIIMRHPTREFGRKHKLWNVACDLFVNKDIYAEYGCGPDNTKVVIANSQLSNGKCVDIGLEFIPGALFEASIDTDTITVEEIYDKLEKENNREGSGSSKSSGSGQEESGENSDGSSSNSESSQEGDSEGNSESGQKGSLSDLSENKSPDNGKGSGSKSDKGDNNDDITYNGKKVCNRSDVEDDLFASEEDTAKTPEERDQESRSLVQKVIEKYKMMGKYDKNASKSLKMVEELLEEVPKYANILRRYMTEMTRKQKTYKRPNKRISNAELIYKGKAKAENNGLSDVHFAMDTSGSITTEEATQVLSQVLGLMKKFDLTGRVILWDTEVNADMEFKNVKDIVQMKDKIKGNGGTDINCYFNYIQSDKCRRKPKLIVIYTDGYFSLSGLKPLPRGIYGPVVWIISGRTGYKQFNPEFGIVAPAKND